MSFERQTPMMPSATRCALDSNNMINTEHPFNKIGKRKETQNAPNSEIARTKGTHILFEQGIIGFGNNQEYVLAPVPKESLRPFQVLVHTQNPSIHFLLLKFKDADESVTASMREEISLKLGLHQENLEGYYLVTSEGFSSHHLSFSINKRAPLFIDPLQQKGGQYILKDQDLPFVCVLADLSQTIRERLIKEQTLL